MRTSKPKRLLISGTAVALAALSITTASTHAYGAERPAAQPAVNVSYSVDGNLFGVADVSATEAWAVGWSGTSTTGKTLLLHWNGQKWSPVTTPKPVRGTLLGVTEVSSKNIYAVGYQITSSSTSVPLVLHYNGSAWSRVSGTPTVNGEFNAIGQAGSTLLAVGALNAPPMLNMERVGSTWKRLPVPSAAGDLESLVVTGAKDAWAAGVTTNAKTGEEIGDVLLRWNGSSWTSESFPLHGTNENLWNVAGGPGGVVWAVGDSHNNAGTSFTPLSMVWNGSSWRKVTVSAPADSSLGAAAYIPGGTAWAVGGSDFGKHTLILRWTGTAWKQVASPTDGSTSNALYAVAASSTGNAWAVGGEVSGSSTVWKTVILHWNGSSWS
jgi:hypothetical protein